MVDKDYVTDLEEKVSNLQEEVDDLNDYISKHTWIDIRYLDSFIKLTQLEFDEQLKLFYNLNEKKDLFSSESSYEEMFEQQRKIVYDLACCLLAFDRLEVKQYYNFYIDEIEKKYEEFPKAFEF